MSPCAGSCPDGYQSLFSHCALTLVKVNKTKMKVLVRSTRLFFFFATPHCTCDLSSPTRDGPAPPAVDRHLNRGHDGQGSPPADKVGGIWGVPSESSGHVASSGRLLGLSQSAVPSCESKEEGTSVKC